MALLLLAIVTVAVAFSAEYLVGSIEGIDKSYGISDTFVGSILIPIVSNTVNAIEVVTVILYRNFNPDFLTF